MSYAAFLKFFGVSVSNASGMFGTGAGTGSDGSGSRPVKAKDEADLVRLIKKEIKKNGYECSLNHIDVSGVVNMSGLFSYDVIGDRRANDIVMENFNGDISQWDVSNVEDMQFMFAKSRFNGDISGWDVSGVRVMNGMFYESMFKKDISNWKPVAVYSEKQRIDLSPSDVAQPYWSLIKISEERVLAIEKYHFCKLLKEKVREDLDGSLRKEGQHEHEYNYRNEHERERLVKRNKI